jgi:hypothetical protein
MDFAEWFEKEFGCLFEDYEGNINEDMANRIFNAGWRAGVEDADGGKD